MQHTDVGDLAYNAASLITLDVDTMSISSSFIDQCVLQTNVIDLIYHALSERRRRIKSKFSNFLFKHSNI